MPTEERAAEERVVVSSSPHAHSGEDIQRIMFTVVVALIPATLFSFYLFGLNALRVYALALVFALLTEAAFCRFSRRPLTIYNGSAVVTGILLAMNLPPCSPWWMVVLGAVIAIGLGKEVYGGLGSNPFNPALVARVVLLISFPVHMTTWLKPGVRGLITELDAVSAATPLDIIKTYGLQSLGDYTLRDMFLGNTGGSLGEMSALALLLGGALLLWKRVITWHTPAAFVGSVAAISLVFWLIDPSKYADPLFHIFSGGLMLGAFFMATDLVTTPVTPSGMLIFGLGCGIITMVIRMFGGYPEGVSFSILLMNAATPLLDQWTRPRAFGQAG